MIILGFNNFLDIIIIKNYLITNIELLNNSFISINNLFIS